jgi:N-acetylneuraminate synthase/N,N'-diacetyllegionaminate synthase
MGTESRVVCSTDDLAIAATAREWGAETPFIRPANLASDRAPTIDVILHCIQALAPDRFDLLVLLQPTSPMTAVVDVLGTMELCRATGSPAISVCPLGHPAAWQYAINSDGRLTHVVKGDSPTRRQDAQVLYRINGAVYVATPQHLQTFRSFEVADTRAYVMPSERSVDIDTSLDLRFAESCLASQPRATIRIGDTSIGRGQPCFIIAEAGVNHNGDLQTAHQLVAAAAAAGANAVKFQTWITERICKPGAKKAQYQQQQCPYDDDQFAMLKRLELPYEWHAELKDHAERLGLIFLSTPDEIDSAHFLCQLGVPAIKVGSGELTNLPYLRQLAALGKPIILSTGMGHLSEVSRALEAVREAGHPPIALLHCVSAYPAPEEEMNLRAMTTLRDAFGVAVGLSDHTNGHTAAVMGVALGMCVLEKHLTLDRSMRGPDHAASADPADLTELVRMVRKAEVMLGTGEKRITSSEVNTRQVVARTLVYAVPVAAGQRVKEEDFEALRCGQPGLPPEAAARLVGRVLRRSVSRGDAVAEGDLQ